MMFIGAESASGFSEERSRRADASVRSECSKASAGLHLRSKSSMLDIMLTFTWMFGDRLCTRAARPGTVCRSRSVEEIQRTLTALRGASLSTQ
jgi:hypothetical protein